MQGEVSVCSMIDPHGRGEILFRVSRIHTDPARVFPSQENPSGCFKSEDWHKKGQSDQNENTSRMCKQSDIFLSLEKGADRCGQDS